MSTSTDDLTVQLQWLTPEQVARHLPRGNADWVRQQLRSGRLRGSKVGGSWFVDPADVREMIAAGSNSTARSEGTRRRRQRSAS